MLRFILVNCSHIVVKYSVRFKKKYNSIVRRVGKSRAIVAIARILTETIYTMLSKRIGFVDEIDSLTERKIRAMEERAKNPGMSKDIEERLWRKLSVRFGVRDTCCRNSTYFP